MNRFAEDGKYTEEAIAAFAAAQKCTSEEFSRRWIILCGSAYWLHGPNGYLSPIGAANLSVYMRDYLACAKGINNGVQLTYMKKDTDNGGKVETQRKPDAVLLDHATGALAVAASMSIPHSYFDPKSQTFYERVCPQRKIAPRYDEQVDHWLRLLGGERAQKLLDWTATATLLDRATCALYLHGGKDTGKSLFAMGMARLWAEAPTDMRDVNDTFNSGIADCPLVLADEKIPRDMDSGDLRTIISRTAHTLRRKQMPSTTITGSLRIVIAANTPNLLKFNNEDFMREDIDAIASRILYIPVSPAAKDYLDSLGGASGGTSDWVKGDRIAAHALWLAANHKVVHGKRFLVEGEIETFHRRLATHGTIRGLVVEWICKALTLTRKDWPTKASEDVGVRFGHGKLFVNSAFVKDTWDLLIDKQIPTTDKVGKALTPISIGTKKFTISTKGVTPPVRRGFYEIDVEHVYRVAEELQIGVAETYKALIEKRKWNWVSGDQEDNGAEPEDGLTSVPPETSAPAIPPSTPLPPWPST